MSDSNIDNIENVKFVGSTKKQVFDALQDAIKIIKKNPAVLSTVEVAKNTECENAINVAKGGTYSNITEALQNLVTNIESASETFESIQLAIDTKKKELKDVHDIEVETNTLAALLVVKDQLVAQKEFEAVSMINNAKDVAAKIHEEGKASYDKMIAAGVEESAAIKLENERNKRVWEYEFSRAKTEKIDALNDQIDKENKKLVERVEDVIAREEECENIEQENEKLLCDIQEIKATIEDAIKEALQKEKAKYEKSHAISSSIVKREHASEMTIKDAKIVSLEEKVEELKVELTKSQSREEAANERVSNMANSALKVQADAETIKAVSNVVGNNKK